MDFKEIRELAINLYKQGKTEEEINKLCKIPITNEMIANWVQEKDEIEKQKKLAKLYKKMKNIKKIEFTNENKKVILEELQSISFQILEIEPNSQIAMNELVRCFSIKKEYEIGRNYGIRILENNPNNIFVLYNMAKLEMKAQNYEKSLEYNQKLLSIEPQNEQGLIQKDTIEILRKQKEEQDERQKQEQLLEEKVRELQKQEQEELSKIQEEKIDVKTKQEEYVIEEKKKQYTQENKEIYMQKLQRMFLDGSLNSKNIERVKQELYLYPNQVESVTFIAELYYLITEKEEKAIEEIDKVLKVQPTLQQTEKERLETRILDFKNRLKIRQRTEEKQEMQEQKNREIKIEQRKYMMQIAQDLNEGKIQKEEIEEIVKKLEKCQDRDKAIFLIIKIFERVEGKEEALKAIEKYSKIHNITKEEKALIVKVRTSVEQPNKEIKTRQQKIRIRNKVKTKQEKFTKQVVNRKIHELLEKDMNIKEIEEQLKNEGEYVSLKTITKIKSHFLKQNDKAMKKYRNEVELATEFIKDNYTVAQVYELFDYNIGKNILNEIRQRVVQKER